MAYESDANDCLETELDLLNAMYPEEVIFSPKSRELKYTNDQGTLVLRLPDLYPLSGGPPELISASNSSKDDIRLQTKMAIKSLVLADGEEALDAILASFQEVVAHQNTTSTSKRPSPPNPSRKAKSQTTIIWLHHLLATSKRKHALNPEIANHGISGITKPGYPGVMLFSGPATAINEHVASLKKLNWQAFHIRYEEEEDDDAEGTESRAWEFQHGRGIREVETMAEVVKSIVGEERRDDFLRAVGVK